MKKYILYILVAAVFCFQLSGLVNKPKRAALPQPTPPLTMPHLPAAKQGIKLKAGDYSKLLGWEEVNLKESFQAFQSSCHVFLKYNPNDSVGSRYISLKAKDWHPVCRAAAAVSEDDPAAIKDFFQTWFVPVEFHQGKPVHGTFTGYYLPEIQGSLKKTPHFSVPIYAVPPNMLSANLKAFDESLPARKIVGQVVSKKMVPFYTRAAINQGAIAKSTPVLAWVNSEFDRLILETEGSGVISLGNGKRLVLGYAADNGAKYRAVASILIRQGYLKADEASVSRIKAFFQKHPEKIRSIMNQNKSFVFFRKISENSVVGGQGVKLSPGYSLAIDRKWIPMGVPLWLTTHIPDETTHEARAFNRLMIAQDTGGSIRGMVRGDIYMGEGEKAIAVASKIKNEGHYWLLLPRQLKISNRIKALS